MTTQLTQVGLPDYRTDKLPVYNLYTLATAPCHTTFCLNNSVSHRRIEMLNSKLC